MVAVRERRRRWPATAKRMNIDVEAIGRDAVPTIMLASGGRAAEAAEVYDDGTRVKFPVQRAQGGHREGFGLEERHAKPGRKTETPRRGTDESRGIDRTRIVVYE